MRNMKIFAFIKAAEAIVILLIHGALILLSPDTYWPDRPSGMGGFLAGWLWLLFLCYVLWGYFFASFCGFFTAGIASAWRPKVVAMTAAAIVIIHQAIVAMILPASQGYGPQWLFLMIPAIAIAALNWAIIHRFLRTDAKATLA